MVKLRPRIELKGALTALAMLIPTAAAEPALTLVPNSSPDKPDWFLFGDRSAKRNPSALDLGHFPASHSHFGAVFPDQESLMRLVNGAVAGSKPFGQQVTSAWSDGAGVLFWDWFKPTLATPLSTRFTFDGIQQATTTRAELDRAAVSTQITMTEPDELLHPGRRREWQTDESVRMAVAGPLFVFGQFGASSPSIDEQQPLRWQGRYGVGIKFKPGIVDEVQVRGGPALRSDETGRLVRGPTGEPSELFLEAVTKVGLPLLGPLNLEYMNTATPSPAHYERSLINQEFRLARPLTGGGQFHVGARYRPDDSHLADSWVERMQVFMGFELKRQPIRAR